MQTRSCSDELGSDPVHKRPGKPDHRGKKHPPVPEEGEEGEVGEGSSELHGSGETRVAWSKTSS